MSYSSATPEVGNIRKGLWDATNDYDLRLIAQKAAKRGRFGLADLLHAFISIEEAIEKRYLPWYGRFQYEIRDLLEKFFPPGNIDLWCMDLSPDAVSVANLPVGFEAYNCVNILFGLERGLPPVLFVSLGLRLKKFSLKKNVRLVESFNVVSLREDMMHRFPPETALRAWIASAEAGTMECFSVRMFSKTIASDLISSESPEHDALALRLARTILGRSYLYRRLLTSKLMVILRRQADPEAARIANIIAQESH